MVRRGIGHKAWMVGVILLLSVSLSGCFYRVLGGVAAAGGYAISRDTIQGEVDREFGEAWDAAVDIISIMGSIQTQSNELGEISGIVHGARITVNVIQLTPETVRLKVRARKMFFPSINTAQNVFIKIMNRLNE